MAVGILSALAGPRPAIPISTSTRGDRLIQWQCYIVDSTIGRKSTVLNFARDLLKEVLGETALIEWEGSPQGLIQRLQERDGQSAVFVRDELSGLISQMNKGGHLAGLSQTLIRAFDGRVLENIRTRKCNKSTGEVSADSDRVESPYLVMLTATTWQAFVERASIDNVLDGLLARFVFVTGSADPRPLQTLAASLQHEWAELVDRARAYHQKAQVVSRLEVEDEVLEAVWALEQSWSQKAKASTRPDAASPALKRLSEVVLRTAGLLALERVPVAVQAPCIRLEHFVPAEAMGQRWVRSTLKVVEALGATRFQRDADAVASLNNVISSRSSRRSRSRTAFGKSKSKHPRDGHRRSISPGGFYEAFCPFFPVYPLHVFQHQRSISIRKERNE